MNLKRFWIVMMIITLFSLVPVASATELYMDEVIVIEANEVIDDDLFVTGQTVTVNGTVKGDLFASGTAVIVNGRVEGSLFIAGQMLQVNGVVDGAVYATGYALTLGSESDIERNVHFGGDSLTTAAGSQIGHNLYGGGYQLIHNGTIEHDLFATLAGLALNGTVGGNVRVDVSDSTREIDYTPTFPSGVPLIPPGFRRGDDAKVNGRLDIREYVTDSRIRQEAAPVPNGVTLVERPSTTTESTPINRPLRRRIGEGMALLIIGGLLLWLWPGLLSGSSRVLAERPLPSTGWGFTSIILFVVALPLVIIALVILTLAGGWLTYGRLVLPIIGLGGTAMGVAVVGFLFVLFVVSKIVVAYGVGQLLLVENGRYQLTSPWQEISQLLIGIILYELLRALPLGLGWLTTLVVTFLGTGAIILLWQAYRISPTKSEITPVTA